LFLKKEPLSQRSTTTSLYKTLSTHNNNLNTNTTKNIETISGTNLNNNTLSRKLVSFRDLEDPRRLDTDTFTRNTDVKVNLTPPVTKNRNIRDDSAEQKYQLMKEKYEI